MKTGRPLQTPSQQGLTLIELVVALALLSIIMLGLVQAMRSIGQTETRIDSKLSRQDQIRVTHSFLQGVLGRMDATRHQRPDGNKASAMLLEHNIDSIEWVGVMPARPATAGRYYMRLSAEVLEDGKQGLVFRYAPLSSEVAFPAWPQTSSQVLLSGLAELQIRAQGLPRELGNLRSEWPQDFQDRWHAPLEPPQRISIAIRDAQGSWPLMVLNVLPTLTSTPQGGGFVTGAR